MTDDVTGTMPPFDKCIVYGPDDPAGVAEKIKQRLGCYGACVNACAMGAVSLETVSARTFGLSDESQTELT